MNIMKQLLARARNLLGTLGAAALIATSASAVASDDPAALIDVTVNQLLDEFTASRDQLETDKKGLFQLVDRVASPVFDFDYISKLVLAKSWKNATEQQRDDFAHEFKRLLIVTYATALFRYTGNEAMTFGETKLREKKGVELATVNTEVTIDDGAPIGVSYSMLRKKGEDWKIYNLTVGDLNMVLNYRNVVQSTIHKDGLDGMIASMKSNNNKNF